MLFSGAPDTTVLKIYIIYDLKAYHTLYANKRTAVERLAVETCKLEKLREEIHHNPETSLNVEKVQKLKNKER